MKRQAMKSQAVIGAVCVFGLLAATAAGVWWWRHRTDAKAAANAVAFEPAEAVDIVRARTERWRPMADLVGTTFAIRSITVSNEIAGVIREVNFDSGAIVEEGQVLLTFDITSEEADLAAAQAAVTVAESERGVLEPMLTLWEANVARLAKAAASNAATARELDDANAQFSTARARIVRVQAELEQAKARVRQVETLIAKKTLHAPFRARASIRNVHPGQYLAEGTMIVALEGITDDIFLDFAVPQEHAQAVKQGDIVMGVTSIFGTDPIKFEVVAIDSSANRSTRNVRIRSRIANPGERLKPGMFVDVSVPVGPESEFTVIPGTAVRRASFGDHVFAIVPSDKPEDKPGTVRASQRFIKVGPAIGPDVIILDGVKPGDEIAAGGSFKLRDGVLITIAPPADTKRADGGH